MLKFLFLLTTFLISDLLIAQDSTNSLWSVELQQAVNISPVFNADKIFIITENGSVICLDKNGNEKFHYDSNENITGSPIVDKDLLFAGTDDGDIISINSNTGYIYQVIGIGESITSGLAFVDVESGNVNVKGVAAGTEFGNIYCYDIISLEPIWINQVSDTIINSTIVPNEHQLFFMDGKRNLYCVSADNGLLIWKITPEEFGWKSNEQFFKSDLVLNGYNLYLTDSSGKLFCVDAMLGTINWSIKNIFSTGKIRLNDKGDLVLPTSKNKILIVPPAQQKIIKEIELPAELKYESVTDVLIVKENLIAGFTNGSVYQLDSKGKAEMIFSGTSSIVSLLNIDGDCLVTDYDGKITLLNISN